MALVENRSDVPLSCNLCREASQITILLEHDPQKPTWFTGACFRHVKEVVALYDSEQGRVARGPRTVPQTTCVGGNLSMAGSLANDTSKSPGENPKDPQTACAGVGLGGSLASDSASKYSTEPQNTRVGGAVHPSAVPCTLRSCETASRSHSVSATCKEMPTEGLLAGLCY